MKKILLTAIAAGFAFTSCKSDDDDTPLIVGTWKINKTVINYADGTAETENPDACEAKTEVIFREDHSVTSNEFFNNGSSCLSDSNSGNYSYNQSAHKLTITLSGDTSDFNVLSLNSSELVIRGQDDDYDGDGLDDQYILHLKK